MSAVVACIDMPSERRGSALDEMPDDGRLLGRDRAPAAIGVTLGAEDIAVTKSGKERRLILALPMRKNTLSRISRRSFAMVTSCLTAQPLFSGLPFSVLFCDSIAGNS